MQKKQLVWNTLSSFLLQAIAIISGFIIPRLIIGGLGSEVNGLVSSITQFLSFITFLELGIGAVVQSALYEPLANHNKIMISQIVASGQKFFTKIALILAGYVLLLMVIYPNIVNQNFGWEYSALLIAIISLNSFAQYYYGVVNSILITADQHGYVQYLLSCIALSLNTIVSALLIIKGFGIHIVKLATSIIFLLRPVVLKIYVDKHYDINRKIKYEKEPLTQKWNGIAQHISAIVLENTDVVVLSLFSSLTNVSIYSVYHLVIYGVKRLFDSTINGVMALMGDLWAKGETKQLKKLFSYTEWCIHTATVFIFGCVAVLICPFISVYMKGVTDANYILPTFAFLMTIAHGTHCLRMPYNIMILAGNHYKQTQSNYIIAAILNLGISVIAVNLWGIVGVALGTLTAMSFQTIWMAVYISNNLVEWPLKNFIKQISIDVGTFSIAYTITKVIPFAGTTYIQWILMAVKIGSIWLLIVVAINLIFYRKNMKTIFKGIIMKIKKND